MNAEIAYAALTSLGTGGFIVVFFWRRTGQGQLTSSAFAFVLASAIGALAFSTFASFRVLSGGIFPETGWGAYFFGGLIFVFAWLWLGIPCGPIGIFVRNFKRRQGRPRVLGCGKHASIITNEPDRPTVVRAVVVSSEGLIWALSSISCLMWLCHFGNPHFVTHSILPL